MNAKSLKIRYRATLVACAVAICLSDANNGEGRDFLTITEYAKFAGCSYQTSKINLDIASDAGFLYKFYRRSGLRGRPSACYTINLEMLFNIVHYKTSPPPPIFQHL